MGIFSHSGWCRFSCAAGLTLLASSSVVVSPRAFAQWNPPNPVEASERNPNGLAIFLERGAIRLEICSDEMIRVRYTPGRQAAEVAEYVVIKNNWPKTNFTLAENEKEITLSTAKLK